MSYDTLRCIRYPIDLRFLLRFLGRWLRLAWHGRNLFAFTSLVYVCIVCCTIRFSFADRGFLFFGLGFFFCLLWSLWVVSFLSGS